MQKITYHLSGLTCGGCVNRAKTALTPWAEHVEVTLNPPQAILTNPKADIAALNQTLSTVGNYQLSAHRPNILSRLKSWLIRA